MYCPLDGSDGPEAIIGYVARTLDPHVHAEFQRHMQTCSRCREAVAAQAMVWSALDSWPAIAVSRDFDATLLRRMDEGERGRWRHLLEWRRDWWRPAIPVAAACALLIGAFLVKHTTPKVAEEAQAQPQIEIEQVEHALDDIELLKQLGVQPASATRNKSEKI